MTTTITPASNIFFNPLLMREIAKYLEPSELGSLFSASKQFFPLVTDTVSSLSLEQRRDFFASHHTRFFARKITAVMTDKELPPREYVENTAWLLLHCPSPKKRRLLVDQVSALIDKEDTSVPRMLDHLTASLMPERDDLMGNLSLNCESSHPYIDSAQAALFNHLRHYFDRSKILDSMCMLEYWTRCTVALPLTRDQKIKNYQCLISFVSSQEMPDQLKERVVELYSYALGSLGGVPHDDVIKEKMLDEINSLLDKGGITLEIKKQILCNLLSGRMLSKKFPYLCERFEWIVEQLCSEVELSQKERGKVLNFLISNLYLDKDWAFSQIDFFSQKEMALEEIAPSIPCFMGIVYYFLDNNDHKIKALDILEKWSNKPMSANLKKKMFYNLHWLKTSANFISFHENIDRILKNINAIQIIWFYFDLDWLQIGFLSKILGQFKEQLLAIYARWFRK